MDNTTTRHPSSKHAITIRVAAIVLIITTFVVIFALLLRLDIVASLFISDTCTVIPSEQVTQFMSGSAVPPCWMIR